MIKINIVANFFVNNQRCDKAGVDVDEEADILVKGDPIPYVSRGGLKLEKAMKKDGMLVTKQYVKGRENVYSSPAVKDYNSTTDSANRTVSTLMKIIRNWNVNDEDENGDIDPLMKMINGSDDDE